jgi:lysophospholipase L1-like esterase
MQLMTCIALTSIVQFLPAADLPPPIFAEGQRVLFQGDSITDGARGRSEDPNHILGHGYAFLIAAKFGAAYPERHLTFINRGISGNRVNDLASRWQAETLDLKPDVVSILIGINDILINSWKNQPVSVNDYEKTYDQLIAETIAANPKVRLVLCEPFILPGKNTSKEYEKWMTTVKEFQVVVEKLGRKYHAPVVHFQKIFNDAARKNTPADYWIWDGIHPTYSGHQLMADEWIRAYRAFYGKAGSKAK